MDTIADLCRSKEELIAENMFLRQQLIVLEREGKRLKLTQRDRQILVLLSSRIQAWRDALLVVNLIRSLAGTGRASGCSGT